MDEALVRLRRDPGATTWSLGCGAALALALGALVIAPARVHAADGLGPTAWVAGGLAALLVGLFGVRGVIQGHLARRLVGRGAAAPPLPWLALGAAGVLSAGITVLGGAVFVAPGLLAAGWLAPLPGLIAVEGLGLVEALAAASARSWAVRLRGARVAGASALAASLVFGNLVFGGVVGVAVLRGLTGLDTAGLQSLIRPGEPRFLLAALFVTGLVMEPVWGALRCCLFLHGRSGSAQHDLLRRWTALTGGGRPSVAALLSLLVAVLAAGAPEAQAGQDAPEPLAWAEAAEAWADRIEGAADDWAVGETVLLRPLVQLGTEELSGMMTLRGQRVPITPSALVASAPDAIRSPHDVDAARVAAAELRAAGARARALVDLAAPESAHHRQVLAAVLDEPGFDLRAAPVGDDRGSDWRERLSRWWDGLFEGPVEPAAPVGGSAPTRADTAVVAAVAVAAASTLALVVLLVARAVRRRASASLPPPAGPASRVALDPRARGAIAWVVEADEEAAAGRYYEAARKLYLAVLAHQDARGAIDARPGRSNGEHLRSYKGPAGFLPPFRAATVAFDAARYGGHDVGQAEWIALRHDSQPLLPGARFERGEEV